MGGLDDFACGTGRDVVCLKYYSLLGKGGGVGLFDSLNVYFFPYLPLIDEEGGEKREIGLLIIGIFYLYAQ